MSGKGLKHKLIPFEASNWSRSSMHYWWGICFTSSRSSITWPGATVNRGNIVKEKTTGSWSDRKKVDYCFNLLQETWMTLWSGNGIMKVLIAAMCSLFFYLICIRVGRTVNWDIFVSVKFCVNLTPSYVTSEFRYL